MLTKIKFVGVDVEMNIGKRIDFFRTLHGITQKELAQKVGVDLVTVNAWENGRSKPRNNRLPAIAKAFGINVAQFLGLEEINYCVMF